MPKTVFLVSCVSKKATTPKPAEQLYQSAWFKKARNWVLRNKRDQDCWFILSAEYGLLTPDQKVSPYDTTLLKMNHQDRHAWFLRVMSSLEAIIEPGDAVILLAGDRYREFLEPALIAKGYKVTVPTRGLKVGEQMNLLVRPPRPLW